MKQAKKKKITKSNKQIGEKRTMVDTAFSELFIKQKTKAKEIQKKLHQVKKELTETEFQVSNTFEKLIGRKDKNKNDDRTYRN